MKKGIHMKIGDYQIEKLLIAKDNVSTYVVSDHDQKICLLRKVNKQAEMDFINNAWFQIYEDYQLNVTNFNYLPKPLVISTYENEAFTVFPHERGGVLLHDVRYLNLTQMEQLLEAVRHLHKKGFIHGDIDENNILLRENGDLLLFGAGEKKISPSSQPLKKQDDYDAIFSIMKRYTQLDKNKLQDGQAPTSLEQLQDLLQTAERKPGLEEKETESYTNHRGSVPELLDEESRGRNLSKQKAPKSKKKSWMIGVGFVLLLFAVVILVVSTGSKEEPGLAIVSSKTTETTKAKEMITTEKPLEKDESKPPELNLQQFTALFPNWQFIKQETIKIGASYYAILGIGQKGTEGEFGKSKVAVIHYASANQLWSAVWESPEYEVDSGNEVESYMGDLIVLNPQDQKKALIEFSVDQYRYSEQKAFTVNEEGMGEIVWEGNGYDVVKKDDLISVFDLGETQLALRNNKLEVKSIGRSEVAPANAVKAHFKINLNGKVVPTESGEIHLKVGEILSFIPDNDETKHYFDEGNIQIYTNIGNPGPVNSSNAELVRGGNAIEFTEEGTFEVLLDYYNEEQSFTSIEDLPATFFVHVGETKSTVNSSMGNSNQRQFEIKSPDGIYSLFVPNEWKGRFVIKNLTNDDGLPSLSVSLKTANPDYQDSAWLFSIELYKQETWDRDRDSDDPDSMGLISRIATKNGIVYSWIAPSDNALAGTNSKDEQDMIHFENDVLRNVIDTFRFND